MSSLFFETPLRVQRQRWLLNCIRQVRPDTVSRLNLVHQLQIDKLTYILSGLGAWL